MTHPSYSNTSNDKWIDSNTISLVIPCFNEAKRIDLLIHGLQAWHDKWPGKSEIIIVNDGSTDDTLLAIRQNQPLQKIQEKIPLRIITYKDNRGKGYALKKGIEAASGNFILTLDADMATPPLALFDWLKNTNDYFDQNTIYIGSRVDPDSEVMQDRLRQAAGRIFNLFIRLLTPLKIRDTQNGFKLYPKKIANDLFEPLQTMGWAHDVEILYRATLQNIQIIPLPLISETIPGTKINVLKDSLMMFIQVLKIRRILR